MLSAPQVGADADEHVNSVSKPYFEHPLHGSPSTFKDKVHQVMRSSNHLTASQLAGTVTLSKQTYSKNVPPLRRHHAMKTKAAHSPAARHCVRTFFDPTTVHTDLASRRCVRTKQ